ncbi:nonessential glutaredoxin [Hypsugopox virus]|nr:nonessential glutaredoxin [Hypsugopox virus]
MAQNFVQNKLKNDRITIFVKEGCPFCKRAIDFLTQRQFRKYKLSIYDIAEFDNEYELRDYFYTLTGANTVPRIFVGTESIGGYSDMMELYQTGEFYDIINVAKC